MLSVRNLTKAFTTTRDLGGVNAVDGISFDVKKGDFFTLLGPSGCGKSTTLQCIAGLEMPTGGEVTMADEVVYCSKRQILVPANKRNLGMVFQSYAIWPHMTVYDNVAFPLVHGGRKVKDGDVRGRVMRALDLVKLADFAYRPSPHLSGGQQQRVALARALVHEPRLLLLDEPLSNLDAALRDEMRVEIRNLVKALGITTIFVTHDQIEALSMSDQIALMRSGRIVQQGAPREIYLRPATAFSADFMGRSNLIPGRIGETSGSGEVSVDTPFGKLQVAESGSWRSGDNVQVVIRPPAIQVLDRGQPELANCFSAEIQKLHFLGDAVEAEITIANFPLRAMLCPYSPAHRGEKLLVKFDAGRCVVVPRERELPISSPSKQIRDAALEAFAGAMPIAGTAV